MSSRCPVGNPITKRFSRSLFSRLCFVASLTLVVVPGTLRGQPPLGKYDLDADRFHFSRVEWDAPVKSEDRNRDEFEAYNDTLIHAKQFTADELISAGNRDVTFKDLVKPVGRDFQFKLLTMEGRLKRMRRLVPTKPLLAAGFQNLYECWVFPKNGADPLCLLVSELPPGIEPAMDYTPAKNVTFAGYYFKLMQYESAAPNPNEPTRNQIRRAPLLMGRSFVVVPEPEVDSGKAWREGFLPGLLAVGGAVVAATLGLTLWFRRGDRTLRQALENRRSQNPFDDGPRSSTE